MSQAGKKKKKLCSQAKAGLPITFHHVQPCDKSHHSNLASQTCPYGYLSPVTLSISAYRAKARVGQERGRKPHESKKLSAKLKASSPANELTDSSWLSFLSSDTLEYS